MKVYKTFLLISTNSVHFEFEMMGKLIKDRKRNMMIKQVNYYNLKRKMIIKSL